MHLAKFVLQVLRTAKRIIRLELVEPDSLVSKVGYPILRISRDKREIVRIAERFVGLAEGFLGFAGRFLGFEEQF